MADFRPLGAQGASGTAPALQIVRFHQQSAPETSSKSHSFVICVFGTDRQQIKKQMINWKPFKVCPVKASISKAAPRVKASASNLHAAPYCVALVAKTSAARPTILGSLRKHNPPFTINYKNSNIVQKPTLILGRCLLTRLSSVPTACSRPTAGGFRPAPLWFAIRIALPTLREVPPLYRCTSARQMMPAMLLQKTTGSLRSLYWADLREDKMINSGPGFWHIFGPSGPREPRERPWL